MKTSIYDLAHSKGVPIAVTKAMLAMQERIAELEGAQPVQPDWLLSSTQDLAKNIARRCYPEVPQFEVFDDFQGVISQIDHMTTGMERKTQPVQLVEPEVPNESQIDVGMMALLQCAESDLESFSPKMCERYAADVSRVYRAMNAQPVQPPQRPWVGLTEEEQIQVAFACGCMSADWLDFARAIESKLKGKNA